VRGEGVNGDRTVKGGGLCAKRQVTVKMSAEAICVEAIHMRGGDTCARRFGGDACGEESACLLFSARVKKTRVCDLA
jgi:hypothetical protein